MIRVQFSNGKTCEIAQSFDELSLAQLKVYVQRVEMRRDELFEGTGKSVTVKNPDLLFKTQIHLLQSLLPLSQSEFLLISPEQIRDMLITESLCSFYFHDQLSVNPIKKIGRWPWSYFGPSDSFHRLSFEEFGFADEAFLAFEKTQEKERLLELVSILFRKPKKGYKKDHFATDGDIREPFNYRTFDFRIPQVKKLQEWELRLVLLWFGHCRFTMLQNYKEVFDQKESNKSEDSSSWIHTAMNIGKGLLNFQAISNQNVYLVFEEMLRLVKQREELEDYVNKNKNGSGNL